MKKARAIVVSLGAIGLVACARKPPLPPEPIGVTMVNRAEVAQPTATVGEVRTALRERRPQAAADIDALVIIAEGGTVTLRGTVADEASRLDLVRHTRGLRAVRIVKDELQLRDTPVVGTTTLTGATIGPRPRGGECVKDALPAEPAK